MAPSSRGEQESLSVRQRQKLFADQYFPGGGALPEDVIRLHDAAHHYTGYSTGAGYPAFLTPRVGSYGEVMQGVADFAGTAELYKRTGAVGLVNSPIAFDYEPGKPMAFDSQRPVIPAEDQVRRNQEFTIKSFNHRVLNTGDASANLLEGKGNLKAPFISPDEKLSRINSPSRRFIPPITPTDIADAERAGREFYGKVADSYLRDPQRPQGSQAIPFKTVPFNDGIEDSDLVINRQADFIHSNPDRLVVSGGARPGALPAGHIMQHVSPPLHPGVDERLYREAAVRAMRNEGVGLRNVSADDMLSKYTTDTLPSTQAEIGAEDAIEKALGPRKVTFPGVYEWYRDQGRKNLLSQEGPAWAKQAPLGREVSTLKMPATPEAAEAIVTARETQRVASAARGGAKAAVGISRAVPWLDPAFRNALDRNDIPAAAKAVVSDYAAGALASPVVAAGAGVLQRAAPRMAGQVLPLLSGAAAGAQRANPILALTMLSGDTPTRGGAADPRRAGYEQRVSRDQAIRAEAARRRGGRWKVGPFTIPELGVSESGGLFFGGPQPPQRQAGARPVSPLAAKPGRPWWENSVRAIKSVTAPPGYPSAGNEATYVLNQLRRGRVPYSK